MGNLKNILSFHNSGKFFFGNGNFDSTDCPAFSENTGLPPVAINLQIIYEFL